MKNIKAEEQEILNSEGSCGIKQELESRETIKGKIEIFEENKKIEETTNVVVFSGREWLAQRAFGTVNVNTNYNSGVDWTISYVAFGQGGATSDILTPSPAESVDEGLKSPVMLNKNESNYLTVESDTPNWQLKSIENRFDYDEDSANLNRQLIVSINNTLLKTDANGPDSDNPTYYDINEIGLFITDPNIGDPVDKSNISLFARTTFSTLRKVQTRQLVFSWKIYF